MKVLIVAFLTPILVAVLKDLYDWQAKHPGEAFDWKAAWVKYSTGIWIAVVLGIMAVLGINTGNLPAS